MLEVQLSITLMPRPLPLPTAWGPDLTSSQAWNTPSRATWSENRPPAKFLWTKLRRLPSLMNGSGKQEAAEIVHMASPTLKDGRHRETWVRPHRQDEDEEDEEEQREEDPPEDAAHDHHLSQTRLNGQTGQDPTQRSQLVVGVQSIQL